MPYAMGIGGGYFIHAWSWDEEFPDPSFGYASHGCISVPLRFAQWLFEDFVDGHTKIYIWGERRSGSRCN